MVLNSEISQVQVWIIGIILKIVICKILYDVELGSQFPSPVLSPYTKTHMHPATYTYIHTLHRNQLLHIYLLTNKKMKAWSGFIPP